MMVCTISSTCVGLSWFAAEFSSAFCFRYFCTAVGSNPSSCNCDILLAAWGLAAFRLCICFAAAAAAAVTPLPVSDPEKLPKLWAYITHTEHSKKLSVNIFLIINGLLNWQR